MKTPVYQIFLIASLAISATAIAQIPPSAGSLNQQLERELPSQPTPEAPEIRVEQGDAPAPPVSNQQDILVNSLHLCGAKTHFEAMLLSFTGFSTPRKLTLTELRAMAPGLGGAAAVRAFPSGESYGDQGHLLILEARKLLPRLSDGIPGQMQLTVLSIPAP